MLNLGCVSSAIFDSKLPAALRLLHEKWPAISLSMMTGMCKPFIPACKATSWMWPLFVPRYRCCLTICKAVLSQRKKPCWPYLVNTAGGLRRADACVGERGEVDRPARPGGMGLEQYFYDACHSAGIQPDVVQNATDVPTVISLVSAGFGIAMLPASAKAICVQNVVFVDILDRLRRAS